MTTSGFSRRNAAANLRQDHSNQFGSRTSGGATYAYRVLPELRLSAGFASNQLTGPAGLAMFLVTPSHSGILRVSIRRAFDCPRRPPKNIGVAGSRTPPVTG